MDKYFIYARKSSESEDRQVLSIDSQIKELKTLAEKLELEVVDILSESKSAKEPGREVFNEMLERINNGEATGILCWALDRLARNPIDGGQIRWLLQQETIRRIRTPQKKYKPEDNVLLMSVEFGMADQFIRDLSRNTKRGLREKVEKGWLPGVAPLGYLNDKVNKTIVADPERFLLIRKMWDLMLTGSHSVEGILETANDEWGFRTRKTKKLGNKPLSRSGIYRLFTNSFYCGLINFNGEVYPGAHEPMITEGEFDQVQELLGRKGKPRPQKHSFAYTGLIKCGGCGCFITAEKHDKYYPKTKNLAHYTYYHCTKKRGPCDQKWVRKEDLEAQVDNYLSRIQISEQFKNWALEQLQKDSKKETEDRAAIYQSQQKAHNNTQTKIDKLLDLKLQELISDEEYKEKKRGLLKEQKHLKGLLESTEGRASNWLETAEEVFDFAQRARYWFANGSLEDKRTILRTIGSNLVLKDKKLHIEAEKHFLVIEEGINEAPEISARFEPQENLAIKGKAAYSAALNPTWLPG